MRASLLAFGLACAAVIFLAATVLLSFGNGAQSAGSEDLGDAAAFAVFLVLLSFPMTGGVLAAQRPRNPIGWVFILIGLSFFGTVALEEYAVRALIVAPGSLPAGLAAGWLATWTWVIWIGCLPLVLLLFPDGRLPGRRWRGVVVATLVMPLVQIAAEAFAPGPLAADRLRDVQNPVTLEAAAALAGVRELLPLAYLLLVLAAVAALLVRWRRARALERLQLRTFVYAGTLVGALALASAVVGLVDAWTGVDLTAVSDVFWIGLLASVAALPIGAAISILRYRLYDIDVLINRTLVYGALSATLAATYSGGVILLQAFLRPITSGSELAVAVSTLSVVALFQPLRSRIQAAVDHRFYRSRYDAQRTLDAFSARLRDQVELDAVRADLVGVVHQTIRPSHASVWLRERS